MPIRAINDKRYKGVSELYRKSDGQVTGYYVTYRDTDGKPIKRRVDADNQDEALLKLLEIKREVDLEKQGKDMSVVIQEPIKKVLTEKTEIKKQSIEQSGKTMLEYQKIISEYNGISSVALMDIVAFDDINILYGYETGMRIVDEIQSVMADALKQMREDGLFAKYDVETFSHEIYHIYGDKLCLFIKNDLSHRLLDFMINQLLKKISEHKFFISDKSHIHLNATFGATKADSSVSLIYAEKALQEAKKFHNSYIFYDSYSMHKNEHIFSKVYETLLDNINGQKVTPYFQGIFDVNNSTVPYKFESLMRLIDSDGHVLSPAVFMEKSKEYRLYTQLMSQMIEKVFDVLERYDVSVTLNLSYLDINNPELCEKLLRKVKQIQIGSRLTVEIVESEQVQDIELVNEFIFTLKKSGVLIAIDDFGCGFSNFENIVNLDIDYVKLDGSLVSKIHDKKYRIILENMVKICHDLGIKTIAEYISDADIMQLAKSIGVDYLQGFHLHQPEEWDSVIKKFDLKGDKNA
jgi:EAL domain-containing protein (putative c-di-GMP-specific phosphodiesterase class I)